MVIASIGTKTPESGAKGERKVRSRSSMNYSRAVRIRIGERTRYSVNGRHPVASELTLTLRSILCLTEFTSLRVEYVHSPFLGDPPFISVAHRASKTAFVLDSL